MKITISKPWREFLFHWHGDCSGSEQESSCWGLSLNYPAFKWKYCLDSHWIVPRTWLDVFWSRRGFWFRIPGNGYGISLHSWKFSILFPCKYLYQSEFKTSTKPIDLKKIIPIFFKRK